MMIGTKDDVSGTAFGQWGGNESAEKSSCHCPWDLHMQGRREATPESVFWFAHVCSGPGMLCSQISKWREKKNVQNVCKQHSPTQTLGDLWVFPSTSVVTLKPLPVSIHLLYVSVTILEVNSRSRCES